MLLLLSDVPHEPAPEIPEAIARLSFEEAIERLEALVAALEGSEVPLAEMVEKHEEGMHLWAHCRGCLRQAEVRVEKLSQRQKTWQSEPFEPGGSFPADS